MPEKILSHHVLQQNCKGFMSLHCATKEYYFITICVVAQDLNYYCDNETYKKLCIRETSQRYCESTFSAVLFHDFEFFRGFCCCLHIHFLFFPKNKPQNTVSPSFRTVSCTEYYFSAHNHKVVLHNMKQAYVYYKLILE